ncbi:MAG: class I SAM-dependent methyltransferase [Acidaminococcaceae bacterium]|nr:class I SAM-dependent methyltransferase [Acidaminococcaceae bacterium]
MKFAVTLGKNAGVELNRMARAWAQQLGCDYLPRPPKGTLAALLEAGQYECLVVATRQGAQIYSPGGKLFFHPGMAVLRVQKLEAGQSDNFATACALQRGSRLLDCTLGLAADASVAAWCCGEQGEVVGLEASKPLHFVVSQGLQNYVCEDAQLTAALRRIVSHQIEALSYLQSLDADSFDCVYFDPMFRYPVWDSSGIKPLRAVAYGRELTQEHITQALRVAPRVVIKERSESYLASLGADSIEGGKYSKVKYGIFRR